MVLELIWQGLNLILKVGNPVEVSMTIDDKLPHLCPSFGKRPNLVAVRIEESFRSFKVLGCFSPDFSSCSRQFMCILFTRWLYGHELVSKVACNWQWQLAMYAMMPELTLDFAVLGSSDKLNSSLLIGGRPSLSSWPKERLKQAIKVSKSYGAFHTWSYPYGYWGGV